MAKVTITIEDTDRGTVKVKSDPSMENMFKVEVNTKDGLTSAQGYALTALNAIRKESKRQDPNKIVIPKQKIIT